MGSDEKARRIALLYMVVGLACVAAVFWLAPGHAGAATAVLVLLTALAICILLIGVGRELTTAQAATLSAENRFSRITESAPVGIAVSLNGKFLYLNPYALELFGSKQPGKLQGEIVIDRVRSDDRQAIRKLIEKGATEAAGGVTTNWFRLDGSTIAVEVSAAPLQVDHETGVLLFFREADTPASIEQASTLTESAREFNDALTVINGYAELLLHHLPPTDRGHAAATEILAAGQRGATIAARMSSAVNQAANPASRSRAV